MLNRRHLRIKILHILYGFYQDEDLDTTVKAKSALRSQHYIRCIELIPAAYFIWSADMQGLAIDRIEAGRKKQLPTAGGSCIPTPSSCAMLLYAYSLTVQAT